MKKIDMSIYIEAKDSGYLVGIQVGSSSTRYRSSHDEEHAIAALADLAVIIEGFAARQEEREAKEKRELAEFEAKRAAEKADAEAVAR